MIPIEPDIVRTIEGKCEEVFSTCKKELTNLVGKTLILVCDWSFFLFKRL